MSQVSIVIPVYNAEKTLVRCLDSVQSQTYTDFEVILVNDGSEDSSAEICKKYCEADKRFRLINQENQGPSEARNRGIDEACSKYIAFVDSDDYAEPTMLEEFFTAAEASGADLTICGYYLEGYPYHGANHLKYPPGVYRGEQIRQIALDAIDIGVSAENMQPFSWIRFVRRECLENPRLRFNTSVHRSEDYLIWNILFARIDSVCLIGDKPLYHHVLNDDSITRSYIKGYWEMSKTIYTELKSIYHDDLEMMLHLNIMLLRRATLSLTISSRADDKEIFKGDLEKVLSDKELRAVVKSIPFRAGIKHAKARYLLFKFRLYFIVRLVYNFRYRKNH